MPPRPAPIYTPFLHSLITSTSYPPIPTADELESIKNILSAQHAAVSAEYERKVRKEKKRKEKEEGEAAALEANERAGAKLEALERARLEASKSKKGSPSGVKVKRERSVSPAPSNASSSSFRPQGQPITYGQNPLKKKKKRVVDSDDESRPRDRSTTLASPPPSHQQSTTSGLKLKLSSSNPKSRPMDPSPVPTSSFGAHIDFSLPNQPSRPLIPPRPEVQKPLKPGPKRQSEVDEDFSNTKAPNQVLFTTFWSSVEPYLRELREDDLAMLGFKADAPESYEIPAKGRHYTEVWDEEDGLPPGSTPRVSVPNMRQWTTSHFVPASEMRDETLVSEHAGLGAMTERVVAAVVGDRDIAEEHREEVSGRPAEDGSRDAMRVDVVDLEDRMKRELRSVMLLGEHDEFDPNNRDDDEITSSLRQCQRLLLQQTAVNDARKARLAERAKLRLAYVEYTNMLEGIERSIEAGWAKRVKKYGITPKKVSGPGQPIPQRPRIQENLRRLCQTRQRWIDTVGRMLKERPPGEVCGLPTRSIYDGIGEESEERDEKTVDDAVEVASDGGERGGERDGDVDML